MERGKSRKIVMMGTKSMETAAAVYVRRKQDILAQWHWERKQHAVWQLNYDLILEHKPFYKIFYLRSNY